LLSIKIAKKSYDYKRGLFLINIFVFLGKYLKVLFFLQFLLREELHWILTILNLMKSTEASLTTLKATLKYGPLLNQP
jgi:hypothetical protein